MHLPVPGGGFPLHRLDTPSVSEPHSIPLRASQTVVPDVPFAVGDTQRTALYSCGTDKTCKSLFLSEDVGWLFRNKNKSRSHFVVHPHDEGNASKQIPDCIHTHQSLLPIWTQAVPLALRSLSLPLHVWQIPALRR